MNRRIFSEGKKEAGFSLLEVMLAVLLLGIVLAPMMNLFTISGRISASSWSEVIALNLAQAKLEEMKDTSFDGVVEQSGAFPDNPDYNYTISVTLDGDDPSFLKIVTVTVNYGEAGGPNSVTLTMEKSRR